MRNKEIEQFSPREIEVKIRISSIAEVILLLEKRGIKFSEPIHQLDLIFVQDETQFPNVPQGAPVIRIRHEDGKSILTSKVANNGNELDSTEYELEISNPYAMAMILDSLSLKQVVEVEKTRKTATYKGFHLCLDDVKDLGSFLEIEFLSTSISNQGPDQDDLVELLNDLGLDTTQRVYNGYDTLLYNKNR